MKFHYQFTTNVKQFVKELNCKYFIQVLFQMKTPQILIISVSVFNR